MSTYTHLLYQIVFSTRNREKTLVKANRDKLYIFISGILKNKKCRLIRIGGVEDHLHIVTRIHPSIALSALVKDIKLATSSFFKIKNLFPDFKGWQDGYGAFTYSASAENSLIDYVNNQEHYHLTHSFTDEYIALLKENEVDFDLRYLD